MTDDLLVFRDSISVFFRILVTSEKLTISKTIISPIKAPHKTLFFSNTAFWVGYRENGGVTTTQYGSDMPWNIPYAENEPNDAAGNEECVRIINGQANDARCSRNWTGNRNDDLGMGFICEKQPCK